MSLALHCRFPRRRPCPITVRFGLRRQWPVPAEPVPPRDPDATEGAAGLGDGGDQDTVLDIEDDMRAGAANVWARCRRQDRERWRAVGNTSEDTDTERNGR